MCDELQRCVYDNASAWMCAILCMEVHVCVCVCVCVIQAHVQGVVVPAVSLCLREGEEVGLYM